MQLCGVAAAHALRKALHLNVHLREQLLSLGRFFVCLTQDATALLWAGTARGLNIRRRRPVQLR